MKMKSEKYANTNEAAEILNINVRTVYQRIENGKLKPIKDLTPYIILFNRKELEAMKKN